MTTGQLDTSVFFLQFFGPLFFQRLQHYLSILIIEFTSTVQFLFFSCYFIMMMVLFPGAKKRRNIILDQTNVYATARKRKMKNFSGFIKIAAVLQPTDSELNRRAEKRTREEGKLRDSHERMSSL